MASSNQVVEFGPFKLEIGERRLVRDGTPVPVTGKAFDTLCFLVENGGRLVTKEQILSRVWPDAVVEEGNLTYTISTLRKALGESRLEQPYIETVPRQGYRFVAPIRSRPDPPRAPAPKERIHDSVPMLVGREAHLSHLRDAFSRARHGSRQCVFITGDAGIGKTTLVNAFLAELTGEDAVAIARGECVEHKGPAEPYMPVLTALAHLSPTISITELHDVLAVHAPTWLEQLPWLVKAEDTDLLHRVQAVPNRDRMLREIMHALAVLASERPFVLVLEDLHCCDYATLDFLSMLGRHTSSCALLLVATYRASDAKARSHPLHLLVRELKMRHDATELALDLIDVADVQQWMSRRFDSNVASLLAPVLHRRTDGNPLFIETIVQSWLDHGQIRRCNGEWQLNAPDLALDPPASLRDLLEQQLQELTPLERGILESASVTGAHFCTRIITHVLQHSSDHVERVCADMARAGTFFYPHGTHEYPDGSVCDAYRFKHSLFADIIYSQLTAGQRVRLHGRVAQVLEDLFGERRAEIAGELARQHLEARHESRALDCLQIAAAQAVHNCAHNDAIIHLSKALELIRRLPAGDERDRREVAVQSLRGPALMATRGFADSDAEFAFKRTMELAARTDHEILFRAVFGLSAMLELRGDFVGSHALMQAHLPERESKGEFVIECRQLLACSTFHQGQFAVALDHALTGLNHFSTEDRSELLASFAENPGVECHAWAALSQWFLGKPEQALQSATSAVEIAQTPAHSYSLGHARAQIAVLHQLRRSYREALLWADQAIQLGQEQGLVYRVALGRVLRGWAQVALGDGDGLDHIHAGIESAALIGANLDRPYLLALLAESLLRLERSREALACLEVALAGVAHSHSFFYEAEIWRLRAVALSRDGAPASEVDRSFERALSVARAQSASCLELRILLSNYECAGTTVRQAETAARLARQLSRFIESSEKSDFVAASTIVDTLATQAPISPER